MIRGGWDTGNEGSRTEWRGVGGGVSVLSIMQKSKLATKKRDPWGIFRFASRDKYGRISRINRMRTTFPPTIRGDNRWWWRWRPWWWVTTVMRGASYAGVWSGVPTRSSSSLKAYLTPIRTVGGVQRDLGRNNSSIAGARSG